MAGLLGGRPVSWASGPAPRPFSLEQIPPYLRLSTMGWYPRPGLPFGGMGGAVRGGGGGGNFRDFRGASRRANPRLAPRVRPHPPRGPGARRGLMGPEVSSFPTTVSGHCPVSCWRPIFARQTTPRSLAFAPRSEPKHARAPGARMIRVGVGSTAPCLKKRYPRGDGPQGSSSTLQTAGGSTWQPLVLYFATAGINILSETFPQGKRKRRSFPHFWGPPNSTSARRCPPPTPPARCETCASPRGSFCTHPPRAVPRRAPQRAARRRPSPRKGFALPPLRPKHASTAAPEGEATPVPARGSQGTLGGPATPQPPPQGSSRARRPAPRRRGRHAERGVV
eukprot:gene23287-biopygen22303